MELKGLSPIDFQGWLHFLGCTPQGPMTFVHMWNVGQAQGEEMATQDELAAG